MKDRSRLFHLLLILVSFLFAMGCSSGGGDDATDTPDDTDGVTVAEIYLVADPGSINVGETSAITATVYDASGSPISGVQVGFSLSQPSLAAISPSIATTNNSGVAQATLTARDNQGTLTITAYYDDVTSNDVSLAILSGVTPETINVTATPSTLLIRGTSSIQAEVLDREGLPVEDGTSVSFEVSNPNFGSMSADLATTVNGFASSTFSASELSGTATVEVSVGAINNSTDIRINTTQPAAIEFVSAEPQRIALRGSGGTESSVIQFRVVDGDGEPVQGQSVKVVIAKGPNGEEYIDDDDTPKEIDVSSDADGIAQVTLRSGLTAGPVTLKATLEVDGVTFTTNSSVISIGGGVPTASRFSVAASVLNIPGLNQNNLTTEITAYMSDRYGNYNILEGTTVSFWSEAALAVDASTATVDEDGLATVTARTQHPALDVTTGGQDVAPLPWETNLVAYLQSTYPGFVSDYLDPEAWALTTTPRDGQVSVMTYCQGEEHFDDTNANGVYDSGESFQDTHDDPFLDYNDNDTYDVYVSSGDDPTEIFNDSNDSGSWDSYNGVWDDQKDIFTSFKLLITGPPIIAIEPTTFTIANGGSASFIFIVADRNLNYLSAGTEISVSADGGGKVYADSVTLDDSSYLPGATGDYRTHLSRIEYTATLADDDPADTDPPETVALSVNVEWEGNSYSYTITGTVD